VNAEPGSGALSGPVAVPRLHLLEGDAFARMLAEGAELVAGLANARTAALILTQGSRIAHEGWFPGPARADARRADRMRTAGLDHALGRPVARGAAAARLRTLPLAAHGESLGAIVLEFARPPARNGARLEQCERAARVLSEAIAGQHERTTQRANTDQRERWFRQLDQQVRVLDRERQKLAAVVNQGDTYVFVTDVECRIRWTNRTMVAHTPSDASDWSWMGRGCHDVCSQFSSDSSVCASCPVARALQQNEPVHHEFRENVEGRVRTLYLSALPITDVSGKPQEAMVMVQDLSDLETLRESEERYRVLTQAASDGIVTIDDKGTIIFVNEAMHRIFGYAPEALVGQPLTILMPAAMADHHRTGLRNYLATGLRNIARDGIRVPARHESGREIIVEMSFGESLKDGRPYFTGVMRDITDRRRAEVELKRAQEQLRVVVSNSPIVLFAIDQLGNFTLSEGRGLDSLGLQPGETVGQSAFELYANAPNVIENLRSALEGREFTTTVEVGSLAFETCFTPLRDDSGEVSGVIGVATDVTERRKLEHQLRHAHKMEAIGRLAAGVAHDFNNRLTTILGYSSLLLQRTEPGSEPDRRLLAIKHAAERASELTKQLLTFSRKQVVEPHVSDLNRVVTHLEDTLARLAGGNVQLSIAPAREPAPVRADAGHVEQLLINLIVNARDAMPAGGAVRIEVANALLAEALVQGEVQLAAGPCVTLTVQDTGGGMDAETLSRIFEPFYTSKAFGLGTGLGLAIVYGIVQQHGGHIAVHSKVGQGSSFVITLPRSVEPPVDEGASTDTRPQRGTETVLLVEDKEPVRTLAHEILVSQGYTVLVAEGGADALEQARQHARPIELLVTDVVMPGMSGGELADRLLEVRPGLRVLFVSGFSEDESVRQRISRAGSALLEKPFTCEALSAKVRELLDDPS
jgi:PAS domain S-box-containing protein